MSFDPRHITVLITSNMGVNESFCNIQFCLPNIVAKLNKHCHCNKKINLLYNSIFWYNISSCIILWEKVIQGWDGFSSLYLIRYSICTCCAGNFIWHELKAFLYVYTFWNIKNTAWMTFNLHFLFILQSLGIW